MTMKFTYTPPATSALGSEHHATAAAGNAAVVEEAIGVLKDCVSGANDVDTLLLKAAAGAGKSFALRRMVAELVDHPSVDRVGVTAFTNNQVEALVRGLSKELGLHRVGWLVSKKKSEELDPGLFEELNICTRVGDFGEEVAVFVGTSHKLGARGEIGRMRTTFGKDDFPFEVLLVDEAWQLPGHLFAGVAKHAPVVVGVGDVGQLPPLEIGDNPWRGDDRYNPYRAWPHSREHLSTTWARELPTVWRPAGEQLALWQAFYPEWNKLTSVAAPGDRRLAVSQVGAGFVELVHLLSSGTPVLLEVDGLPDAEAADVDLPLTRFAEKVVESLVAADVRLEQADYADDGSLTQSTSSRRLRDGGDAVIAVLATRNQTVDDAADAVERIRDQHDLPEGSVIASTVDSWQGQTNGITIALHPLSGADALDEFNSAFGRLAVTCTRATHGLLVLARSGLDELLNSVAARPGTPFGEPGERQLPRQTHQRILNSFARATMILDPTDLEEN